MAAPDTSWLTVDDVQLQDGGTVTTGGKLVSYETAAHPTLTLVAGTGHTSLGSTAHPERMLLRRLPPDEEAIPEGILLAGRNEDNWYHWLAEYFPRALTVPEDIAPHVPVLVSRRTPTTGVEALLELTERRIVLVDPMCSQPAGRLHVAAPVVQVLDTGHADWATATTIDRAPLDALRARLAVDVPREGAGSRVLLTRRSAPRGIRNQERLEEIAHSAGLDLVDPGGMTLAEQRELFSTAELVVGASGAVMANYLLMRPGYTIVALTSEHLRDFVLLAVMAAVAGCSFRYVLGTSDVSREGIKVTNHWIHADFTIDEAALTAALSGSEPRFV
jgi:capsular polysaccharide biosynthesis protein